MDAQSSSDTLFRQKAVQSLISIYHQFLGNQAGLYNGPEYEPYPMRFKEGQPYFEADSFSLGSVRYDGLDYSKVFMKYDLVRDELLILNHDGFNKINLIKDKVVEFSLFNHRFINIIPDSSTQSSFTPGFYDLLHDGKLRLLAKRAKDVQQTISSLSVDYYVRSSTIFFLLKNGVYHLVRNKKSLLEHLKDKRSGLQQFIKANNIKFKKNFEVAAIKVLDYYDQTIK